MFALVSAQTLAAPGWERFFGGARRDTSFAIAAFADGGTIAVGYTRSHGRGDADILMLRLDRSGALLWQKTYGGVGRDMATSVAIMPDGGFVTAAITQAGGYGGGDALIMRHDRNGRLVWQKRYGGAKYDIPYAIKVSRNGHIVVAGYTKSAGVGDADGWIFCLDGKGKPIWERTYGAKGRDWLRSVAILPNGDIAVAGGVKPRNGNGIHAWAMMLDRNGELLWDRVFSSDQGVARTIISLGNGQVAIAGWMQSKKSITGRDIWIARLDKKGRKIWDKKLVGPSDEHTEAIIALPGGRIAMAGGAAKNLAVMTVRAALMLLLDERGKIAWQKYYGNESEQLYSIAALPDGNIAAAGAIWRKNRGSDVWIFTLDRNGHRAARHAPRRLPPPAPLPRKASIE
jgi:hypothetical protein